MVRGPLPPGPGGGSAHPGPLHAGHRGPPIPPLASQEEAKPQAEAPAQEEAQAPASSQEEAQAPPPAPVARAEPPPPNPFVPLVVETPPPPPASASRPTPVPEGPAVRVQTPAQAPQAAPATRPIPGTSGALPAPKILSPALSAPLPQARETPPKVAVPTALVEAPSPGPRKRGRRRPPPRPRRWSAWWRKRASASRGPCSAP